MYIELIKIECLVYVVVVVVFIWQYNARVRAKPNLYSKNNRKYVKQSASIYACLCWNVYD